MIPVARFADDGRLDRSYAAVVLDWDGTAVPDRAASAGELRTRIEELCRLGTR